MLVAFHAAKMVTMAVLEVMIVMMALEDTGTDAQEISSLPPLEMSHKVVLDQMRKYIMLWTPRENDIIFEVQVATMGYVGLGFSPNGGMKGADMVVGWVDDSGLVFLHDRYSSGYKVPSVDTNQDVQLLGGYQNDTHTVLRFSRPWITCDGDSDYQLSDSTVRVIWAYNSEDPADKTNMKQHEYDHRGTKSLYLRAPQFSLPPLPEDVKTWDVFSPNVTIPQNLTTLYWCKIFKVPSLTRKNHIIGYIPVIEEKNLANVHHILLYACHLPESARHFEKWLDIDGSQCYGPNMPVSWRYCASPFVAWGVGGDGVMLPDNVGLPMGEEHGGPTYLLMEIHYDNPGRKAGIIDNSGIRIFHTERLREYDMGILMVGHKVSPLQIIPPNQEWLSVGHCGSFCTQKELPEEGIKVFEGVMHAHLMGSALTLRHIRNGRELPAIVKDMTYDFNYQQSRMLKEEVTILPGDSLITECVYDSTSRPGPSFGGFGTQDEMCLGFMSYYPRVNLSVCTSSPQMDKLLGWLGIQDVYDMEIIRAMYEESGEVDEQKETELLEAIQSGNASELGHLEFSQIFRGVIVKAPEKYLNTSLYDVLHDEMTWKDEQLLERLQEAVAGGAYVSTCRSTGHPKLMGDSKKLDYPHFVPLEPAVEQCDPEQRFQEQSGDATGSLPFMDFTHRVILDQWGNYIMLWTPKESDIVFEVQVATRGYVALGFSPSGGMKGADVVLGWVDDSGHIFLHDRYSSGYKVPSVDASQDIELLGGYQNDTHTVLRFSRPWTTCDHGADYQLSGDTVRVIWAYDSEDPSDKINMKKHEFDQRGTKSLYLQEPQFVIPTLSEDVKTWELLSPNISLPDNLKTLYWCRLYKIPPLTRKHHAIGFVPVVEEKNLAHVHHIVVYQCQLPDSARHLEKWLDFPGGQCFAENMPVSWNYCRDTFIAWAIGSEGEMYPDHVGLPMGEEHGGSNYYMMEMHYDNPYLKKGIVDASGMRILYTDQLRKYDAGNMVFGLSLSPMLIIPPKQKWLSIGYCASFCTQKAIPEEGIHLFRGLLHSHLLGHSLLLRHIRDGQELPVIMKDETYDFNYQQSRTLDEEVTILPGDSLITECVFDSTNRSKPTFGGLGTQEEMCLAYVMYYPRANLSLCLSIPKEENIFQEFGIQDVQNKEVLMKILTPPELDKQEDMELYQAKQSSNFSSEFKPISLSHMLHMLTVNTPEKYANMTVYDIVNDDSVWQDELIAGLQKTVVTDSHLGICLSQQLDVLSEPQTIPYPDFTPLEPLVKQCSVDQQGSTDPVSSVQSSGSATVNQGSTSENSVSNTIPLKPLPCPPILPSCQHRRKPFTQLGNRPFFF